MPYRLIASAKVMLSSEMIIVKNSIFILNLKFDTGDTIPSLDLK